MLGNLGTVTDIHGNVYEYKYEGDKIVAVKIDDTDANN